MEELCGSGDENKLAWQSSINNNSTNKNSKNNKKRSNNNKDTNDNNDTNDNKSSTNNNNNTDTKFTAAVTDRVYFDPCDISAAFLQPSDVQHPGLLAQVQRSARQADILGVVA